MTFCTLLTLYGPAGALEKAKGILENHPSIKRIDCSENLSHIKLLSSEPIQERILIPLLMPSGISGFRLEAHQTFSRNGSPLSL